MAKHSPLIAASIFTLLAVIAKLKFIPLEANFAMFGALSLFCGAYLRGWAVWVLPIAGMAVSDILGQWLRISGVHLYDFRSMLFNYAGFAAMIGIGHCMRRRDSLDVAAPTVLAGSLAFFLISNFGCWLDPQIKCETSLAGLIQCYTQAIPFYRATLISDVVFALAMFGSYRFAKQLAAEPATNGSEA